MKKPTRRRKKANIKKSRKSSQAGSTKLPAAAEQDVARGAHGLDARVRGVQRKADELHKEIRKAHGKTYATHGTAESRSMATDGLLREEDGEFASERAASGKPFPIVGIGASAGGFEAFSELLKFLPADTGMAFVLVQHLDPKHKSQLSELLGRGASVPVIEARD